MATAAMKNLRGSSVKTRADRFPPKHKPLSGQTAQHVGPGSYEVPDMSTWNHQAGGVRFSFNSKTERRLQDGRKDHGQDLVHPAIKLAPGQAPPADQDEFEFEEEDEDFDYPRINDAPSQIKPSYSYSIPALPRKTWIDAARSRAAGKGETALESQAAPSFFHLLEGRPAKIGARDEELV